MYTERICASGIRDLGNFCEAGGVDRNRESKRDIWLHAQKNTSEPALRADLSQMVLANEGSDRRLKATADFSTPPSASLRAPVEMTGCGCGRI